MAAVSSALKFRDLEHARLHLAALKELFLYGKTNDAYVLRRITALCSAAHTALNDSYCSAKIATMAECAAVWCTRRKNHPAEVYLDRLLDVLDLLQSRIYAIEAIRRASRTSLTH
jgi:hypothetical protein